METSGEDGSGGVSFDLAVTGVGSLPIGDPEQAVAFVAAHSPEVPFWPQLPVRSTAEGMLRQTLGVDPGLLVPGDGGRLAIAPGARDELLAQLDGADPAMTPAHAAGFSAFVRALRRGDLPDARAVKGQLTGPYTLAWSIGPHGGTALGDPELLTALTRRVVARARWQTEVLATQGLPVIVVLDEPVLGLVRIEDPAQNPLEQVLAAIRAEGGIAGVHSCAIAGGDLPACPSIQLQSLDLHGRDHRLPPDTRDRWRSGGILAAGLVPTAADPANLPAAADLATAWLALAATSGDVVTLARRTLVTATCGLAQVGQDAATASFGIANATSRRLRQLIGTTTSRPGAPRGR